MWRITCYYKTDETRVRLASVWDTDMSKKYFIAIASVALASTCTISGALLMTPLKAEASSKKTIAADNDGIDATVRPYINKGQFADAIQKLEALTAGETTAGRNTAWLAFSYLFTGRQSELKALEKKVKDMPANDKDPNAAPIVSAFSLTVQGKLDDAEKLLNGLHEDANGDALLDFAKACVSLKKQNPKQAAEYCEKVVGLCPHFAWGYRTLGFIQDKSLKNSQLAEVSYEKALEAEPNFKDVRGLLVDLRLAKNDFDGAIATSQEAIKLFPHDANNYYRLAQIYIQQWRLNEALDQLQKAVAISKDDPRFYRSMSGIYRSQNKLSDAIAEEEKAVALSKDKPFELIELASLQDQNQNASAAIDSLKAALKESPSNAIAGQKLVQLLRRENRYDDLVAEFKREIELQPKIASLRMSLADVLKHEGKTDEAVEQLKEAANLEQTDPRPHREIAKIQLKSKNYSAAAKSYTRALNISLGSRAADSGTVDDLVALGFCYANSDDYMQAETAFTTAFAMLQLGATTGVQSNVNPSDILRSLASVFLTEGRYREAVVNLEPVIMNDKDLGQRTIDQFMCAVGKSLRDRTADSIKELQATFAALDHAKQLSNLSILVDAYMKLGHKDSAVEAVKKFSDTELKEQCPLALAVSMLAEDRTKEAKELIHKVIDETKGDNDTVADAYVELAHAMIKDGDRSSAIDAFQKATESNPKDFTAFVELGRIYFTDKKNTEAQQQAQKAIDINPYCVPAYLLMGDSNMATDKLKEAEGFFLKAAELYPTSVDAHKGLMAVYQKQAKSTEAKREQEIILNLSKN